MYKNIPICTVGNVFCNFNHCSNSILTVFERLLIRPGNGAGIRTNTRKAIPRLFRELGNGFPSVCVSLDG